MKVKNLILGDIVNIEKIRISMEDYYPSQSDEVCNLATPVGQSLFFRLGNHVIDLANFKGYKVVKEQAEYPEALVGKKAVLLTQPFSELSIRDTISRKDAILVYKNRRIK